MQWKVRLRALRRRADDSSNGVSAGAAGAVDRAASSSTGSPLPGAIAETFGASLGADLSAVRVHTGSDSAEAAGAVSARAYTVGKDIHFGAGQYDPSSASGQHLLAHEVAHTTQQSNGAGHTQHKLDVSTPGDSDEVAADAAADAMVAGRDASAAAGQGGGVHVPSFAASPMGK